MSDEGHKTKGSDNIQIFRIDTSGNIKSVFEHKEDIWGERDLPPLVPIEQKTPTEPTPLEKNQDLEKGEQSSSSAPMATNESSEPHKVLNSELTELKERYQSALKELEGLRTKFKTPDHDSPPLLQEEFGSQSESWKERIRIDLKRIKLKERTIENKYELLRRDTQTLLESKDKQILELKQKTDSLDLEREALEERLRQFSGILNAIDSKKKRLVETLRLAIALLEEINKEDSR